LRELRNGFREFRGILAVARGGWQLPCPAQLSRRTDSKFVAVKVNSLATGVEPARPASDARRRRSRRRYRLSIVPLAMRLLFGQGLLSFAEPEAVSEP
jgi:hypothetical protein